MWKGVTCPRRVPEPGTPRPAVSGLRLETSGRPKKDGGFKICFCPLLYLQLCNGQVIVIPE